MKAPTFGKKLLIVALTLTPLSTFANMHIYNSCNGVLAQGAVDIYRATKDSATGLALKKWLCSTDSWDDQWNEFNGNDIESDVKNALSLNEDGVDLFSWKQQNCQGSDFDYSGSKATHILIQNANNNVIDAWSNCMQTQQGHPLVCYAKQTEQSLRMILRVNDSYNIDDIKINNIDAVNMTSKSRLPNTLRAGEKSIRYTIDDQHHEAYFDLEGQTWNENMSCSYTVPKRPVAETNYECEIFRLNALSSGKITAREYDFFKDTDMVPLFSPETGRYIGGYPCKLYTKQ